MIRRPPRSPLFPSTTLFRSAVCDIDHTRAWAEDGVTVEDNLAHLCRGHHRLKHGSRWRMRQDGPGDRKSTRLNSSHANISYAVFCLKKKKTITHKSYAYNSH